MLEIRISQLALTQEAQMVPANRRVSPYNTIRRPFGLTPSLNILLLCATTPEFVQRPSPRPVARSSEIGLPTFWWGTAAKILPNSGHGPHGPFLLTPHDDQLTDFVGKGTKLSCQNSTIFPFSASGNLHRVVVLKSGMTYRSEKLLKGTSPVSEMYNKVCSSVGYWSSHIHFLQQHSTY
jgi:hypothetical protein